MGKAKFFTTLDLRSGYHHIALDDDAIKKTAFVTPIGKYEYLKVLTWMTLSSSARLLNNISSIFR